MTIVPPGNINDFQLALASGDRPKVGVGVWATEGGKTLLGKRQSAHGAGEWAAPGGHLEYGEGLLACAARELQEETGITAESYHLVTITNDLLGQDCLHYITVWVVATGLSGRAQRREPGKCEHWNWFPVDALPSPIFPPIPAFVDAVGGPAALAKMSF